MVSTFGAGSKLFQVFAEDHAAIWGWADVITDHLGIWQGLQASNRFRIAVNFSMQFPAYKGKLGKWASAIASAKSGS